MRDVELFFICKNCPKGVFNLSVSVEQVRYMNFFPDPVYCGSVLPTCMLSGAGPSGLG